MDRPRRRLRVVDDLRARVADPRRELVRPVHGASRRDLADADDLVGEVAGRAPARRPSRPSSCRAGRGRRGSRSRSGPRPGLASVEPTIVNVSLPSPLSTLTVEPIWTWSVEWFSSMIVAFLISASSVWIRPSTNACSFLASSYSAFSERSPCSLASWMRWATSGRFTDDHLVELGAELLEAVLGEVGGLVVHAGGPRDAGGSDGRDRPRRSGDKGKNSRLVAGLPARLKFRPDANGTSRTVWVSKRGRLSPSRPRPGGAGGA